MRRKHHLRYQGRCTHLANPARSRTTPTAAGLLLTLAALLVIMPAQAQGDSEPCLGGGYNPTPTAVEVTAVPIVVTSTTADYFVLYVKHVLVEGRREVEIPVLVKKGEAGTTTLSESVEALPAERYRVEKYLIADPGDVDGDCIDDITELADPVGMNPVNPAPAIELSDGAVAVPDRETFDTLAFNQNIVKFVMFDWETDAPGVYFMNTNTHGGHPSFLDAVGIDRYQLGLVEGYFIYDSELVAPDGSLGVYYYWLSLVSAFSFTARNHTLLAASMPLLDDNLAYYIANDLLQEVQSDLPLFRDSRITLVFEEDVWPETSFLALNPGEGYGLLRVMDPDERPHPRDVVIYEALPNELSRVAGIITTVPQTPLSHVNLRAVQDGIPNAFISDALDKPAIDDLIGSYVRYTVTESGWTLRAATPAEVEAHYAASRPAGDQTPQRDLSVTGIKPLSEIGFDDWKAFGVKAANLAVLRTLGFPAGTVPDGFAIPFYFYDEFMKAHGFYDDVEEMLADEDFQTDFEVQDDRLDDLRDDIKDAGTPQWIIDALTAMHATYPEGQSLRYRSSTNNEDLPGFNGAGLYDSKTQDPDETEEDGIDKSLKQVFASLWTFRAFTEREFHRIDHLAAAMGVLVHPNYSDELSNGVAVSFDPIRGQDGDYYVNTQIGEDLVTNPEAHSVPEELLLRSLGNYTILATSNLVEPGQLLMSDDQLRQLRAHLEVIHDHFKGLYDPAPGEPFAMEIEFKITSDNVLAIKQARPWVFSAAPPGSAEGGGDGSGGGSTGEGDGSGGGSTGGDGGSGGGGGGLPPPSNPVPSAPRNLEAVGGDRQVTLSWEAPEDDGGFAITDYQYLISKSGRGWISTGSTETTHTVTELTNGRLYVLQVRAVSAAGAGASSHQVEVTPGVGRLEFAHFANGASITSDLVLVNVFARPIRPSLYFYNREGDRIAVESVVELTEELEVAEDGSLTVQTEMQPLEALTISTHGQGEVVAGSVTVLSNGPIGGVLRFDLPGVGVAGVGAGQPLRDALFPARRREGAISTAAAIRNLQAEELVVTCQLMQEGIVLEEVDIDLQANGQDARYIEEVFTATDTSNFSGLVRCTAPAGKLFTGVAVELDAGNGIFTTLPVLAVDRTVFRGGEYVLDFAHFANGSSITSDLVLVNVSIRPSRPAGPYTTPIPPTRPSFYFYDRAGERIAAESVVEVTGDLEVAEDGSLAVQTEMQPLQAVTISTHGQGEVAAGSVRVVAEGPLGGVLRFDLPGVGVAGVGASQPVSDALFPARRQEGGISTAAAIRNLEAEELVVTCQLMQEGIVLEEVDIDLQANGQDARYIEEVFTATDTSNFSGLVRCTAPAGKLFTGVAVELDAGNGIFTTLPVLAVDRTVFRGGEYVLDFAHFANGSSITSDLVLVNVSIRPSRPAGPYTTPIPPTRPSFYFYDRAGERIAAESVVEVTGDLEVAEDGSLAVQTEMQPLQAVTISTHGQGEVAAGSVRVVAEGPLGGVLRFDLPGVGVAGVGASQPVSDALFPARRQEGGISTAAAIRNLEAEELVVSCQLMQEGIVLEEVDIELEVNGQDGRFIEEVFTRTDTSDFIGLVRAARPRESLPEWRWSWTPATASSPRCRWCLSKDDFPGIDEGSQPETARIDS